ncbi:MAG: thioesterase family protein [Planctomycetota bacterium]
MRTVPRPGDSISCEFRVRYAECDGMGLLHHARYWEYFEHVRTELLRRNGFRYRDMEADGTLFVVYKAAIKYLAPIRYDDNVIVICRVERITRTRVDHSYRITNKGVVATEGTSTLACVDREGKPKMMPEELWSTEAERLPAGHDGAPRRAT